MIDPKKLPVVRMPRPLETLNLLDNFLFQKVMQLGEESEDISRILLGVILDRPIRKVRIISQMPLLGADSSCHGIRMDAYIEEAPDENGGGEQPGDVEVSPDIYDIEPNKRYEKDTLSKRMRYYQALIDSQKLTVGVNYGKLPNVTTILILPYDPFDRGRMMYTVKNRCIEEPDLPYEDGATKIFLYTKGEGGSQKLRDMLKYIEKSTAENVTNPDLESIHKTVERIRRDKEVGISYMKSWEIEEIARNEGREEGRELIFKLITALTEDDRMDDIRKMSKDPAYCDTLLQEYGLLEAAVGSGE